MGVMPRESGASSNPGPYYRERRDYWIIRFRG